MGSPTTIKRNPEFRKRKTFFNFRVVEILEKGQMWMSVKSPRMLTITRFLPLNFLFVKKLENMSLQNVIIYESIKIATKKASYMKYF